MTKKLSSRTRQSFRKVKTKTGTKTVAVKAHYNKLNRPKKK